MAEYERLPDPSSAPAENEIAALLGSEAFERLGRFEGFLKSSYGLSRELKFPFGESYGWGYRYAHKNTLLCHVFFEKGAFTVTLSLGKACVPRLSARFGDMLPKTRELWEHRYPCGEGGWVHYRVLSDAELSDVQKLILIRKGAVKR